MNNVKDIDAINAPNAVFMRRRFAHVIALGFGSGLAPFAPGTWGTMLAFPLYWLLQPVLTAPALLAVIVGGFILGIWACSRTGRALGVADHGAIVWDEIVAFMLVLFFTPPTAAWQCGAFLLFRMFDIVKPAPIAYFDRKWKNGFGVMFDDLLAAFYALLVLALIKNITG